MQTRWGIASAAAAAVAASVWLAAGSDAERSSFAEPVQVTAWPATPWRAKQLRDDALRRARVWRHADVARFDFGANPPDPSETLSGDVVSCRFLSEALGGTTPKFNCVLSDGEVVKVKYGRNAEIPAEAAATRLLAGLGFGADRIYIVPRLRCHGCPPLPFHTSRVFGFVKADSVPELLGPDTRVTEYEWVGVERRMEGHPIEADGSDGWAWFELAAHPEHGGADRAEIDALRLVASFLVHWDNKSDNQRLVCVDRDGRLDEPCPHPFAIIQDLGASFGPHKVDLDGWRRTPVWSDRAACQVSMRRLPFLGATFPDAAISGRRPPADRQRPRRDVGAADRGSVQRRAIRPIRAGEMVRAVSRRTRMGCGVPGQGAADRRGRAVPGTRRSLSGADRPLRTRPLSVVARAAGRAAPARPAPRTPRASRSFSPRRPSRSGAEEPRRIARQD